MSEENVESKKTGLGIAIAQGTSIRAWARENGVPESTAQYWSKQPEVRRVAEAWRREVLDRALGRMARHAPEAVDGIAALAKAADSESVRLRAWRSLMIDQIAVSKYAGWDHRLADLEEKFSAQAQGPNFQRGPGPIATSATSDQVPT
jgi:hypothetical protein